MKEYSVNKPTSFNVVDRSIARMARYPGLLLFGLTAAAVVKGTYDYRKELSKELEQQSRETNFAPVIPKF